MDELSFKESDLKFYFVVDDQIKDMKDVPGDMNVAYTTIKEYFPEDESVQWINKTECAKICAVTLTKRHIFVLDNFSGNAFDHLQQTKSLIVGPRCLISCLAENASIPLGKSPVFNTAMRDLVISTSGFSVPEKAKIKQLVFWMGGYYLDDLSLQCTHLVSNTIKSNKYEQASLNAIPIMHSDWVYTVWERNKKETISATSREFEKHYLPIFYNLNITSTGVTGERKNKVMKLVAEHGGTYQKSFKSSTTDILITEKDKTDSDKYQAAVKFKKDCLLPDWIFDSVTKGYALPTQHYKVSRMKISTPTKSDRSMSTSEFNPDNTQLSEISHIASGRTSCTINESCMSIATWNSTKSAQNKSTAVNKQLKSYKTVLEQINPLQAKKAGLFLDGCSVYLSGFTAAEREKLNKILNAGGATRFDEICDKVTHIIVGELIPTELNALKTNAVSAPILRLEWLLESIKLQQSANEQNFIYNAKLPISVEPEIASPASKKTLQTMNHSFKRPAAPKRRQLFGADSESTQTEDPEEKDLLQQYAEQPKIPSALPPVPPVETSPMAAGPAPPSTASSEADSQLCTEDYENVDFFTGMTVYIHKHYDDLLTQVVLDCENAGAKLVNEKFRGVVDYVIVPSDTSTDIESIPVKFKHIVNNLWIEDAIRNNKLVEEEYFHAPINMNADSKPLTGMLIVISLYSSNERLFIESLAAVLGADKDDCYAKKDRPLLICKSPEGSKYKAAIKWGFPVVVSEWLLQCSKEGKLVDMQPYLVGEAVAKDDFLLERSRKKESTGSTSSEDKSSEQPKDSGSENKFDNPLHNEISLRHRRVSELMIKSDRRSYGSGGDTTPTSPVSNPFNTSDFVKEFATPLRETLYNIIKDDASKDKLLATPGTKLKTPPTPKVPDFCTTPEYKKRMLEFYDRYYIPVERNKRRESTPISELRRRIWKEALGDDYVEDYTYTQCNTQNQSGFQCEDDVFAGQSTSDSGTQEENIQSSNFKRLSDFIKQREESKGQLPQVVAEPEIMPSRVPESQILPATAEEKDDMIGWMDPSEFMPRKRSKMDIKQYKGTPIFSISSTTEKEEIISQIKALRGEISENILAFDEKCTHIVCEKPNRGEKILSCIASGKWILGLKYIEDSANAGYFLDEENYEFGNPKATCLPKLATNDQSIASAAFRWRSKVATDPTKAKGVFTGFRVILHLVKLAQFQTVIKAGGGVVLTVQPPYAKSEEALQATHCFVEHKKIQLTPSDHKALAEAGVRVLSVSYLNSYLTNEVEPDYTQHLLSL